MLSDQPGSDATDREVLEQRARELARPLDDEDRELTGILGVVVDGRRYGIRLNAVRDVLPGRRLTRVPQSPSGLLGMLSARGELFGVFELRPDVSRAPSRPAWVVVVDGSRAPLAFAADEVTGAVVIDPDELLPPSAAGTDERLPIEGLTHDGLALVDAEHLADQARFWPYASTERPTRTEQR